VWRGLFEVEKPIDPRNVRGSPVGAADQAFANGRYVDGADQSRIRLTIRT
jgi:hypothetical protein